MKAILSILLFLFAINLFGQIDPNNFNKKLLEHEIKILIDSTRMAHNLPPLYNDSILYVASDHHSQYMLNKAMLSHEEVGDKRYTNPQVRALTFGASSNYLVGENVAYTGYNSEVSSKGRTFLTNNYTEIARSLVHGWINSKGHYKNIITPEYQVTGLAVAIDTKTKRVYACQKFAQVVYTYEFAESKEFFPYCSMSKSEVDKYLKEQYSDVSYPWGLKYDEKNRCEECRELWEYYPAISVRVERNSFVLRVEDAEFVKELIKNRKDGFAVELVPFDAFACGNPAYENEPSRRNEMKRTSGRVLEPVYRKDLMKGFKKRKKRKDIKFVDYLLTADSVAFFKRFGRYKLINFEAKYFEAKLGRVPKDMQVWWNHNLVYIHNKQICHFKYLTNYPGKLDVEMIEVPYYPPIPKNNYTFQLDYFLDSLELFYDAGKTETSSTALRSLVDQYHAKHITITDVLLKGYSSVEGDAAKNEELHQARTENILKALSHFTHDSTNYFIDSEVAWEHFYKKIEKSPKWKFLSGKSREEISAYLKDPKNERPIEILKQERKVKVEIHGVRELSPENALYYVERDLSRLFTKDQRGQLRCMDEQVLEALYEKAYYFYTVDTLTKKEFLGIQIPKHIGMSHHLEHDLVFYRYHLLKDSTDRTSKAKMEAKIESVFKMCGAAEHLSPQFHYLSACLLVEKLETQVKKDPTSTEEIEKAFDRLNLLSNWYPLDSAFVLDVSKANLNVINMLVEKVDPAKIFEYKDIINNSLIHIVSYYRRTNQMNPKTALNLADLACYFGNINLAIALCQDYLYDDDVLKLYLPLAYSHSSYLSSLNELEFEKEFHELLIEAHDRLSKDEWCKLFYGEYGIPFQVMDNKNLHKVFCETCPNRVQEVFDEQ